MAKFTVYGIIYHDKKTEFFPYFNTFKTKLHRFESNPVIDIVDSRLGDMGLSEMLGILSWRFTEKTGITKTKLYTHLGSLPESVDVVNCSPLLPAKINFMDWSDEGHIGIKAMIQSCCDHVGMPYNNNCQHVIYANHFIAKKYIYDDYVQYVLKPCLELLEGDMWEQVNKPAGYTRAMDAEKLKKFTGLDFYNYVPFIMERMFMLYVDYTKPNITHFK